jgi:transposase-like protein
MSNAIIVENGKDHHCPGCSSLVLVSNKKSALYRKAILVFIDKERGVHRFKCKQCKRWMEMPESEIYK